MCLRGAALTAAKAVAKVMTFWQYYLVKYEHIIRLTIQSAYNIRYNPTFCILCMNNILLKLYNEVQTESQSNILVTNSL